jgi:hypothetical protein
MDVKPGESLNELSESVSQSHGKSPLRGYQSILRLGTRSLLARLSVPHGASTLVI